MVLCVVMVAWDMGLGRTVVLILIQKENLSEIINIGKLVNFWIACIDTLCQRLDNAFISKTSINAIGSFLLSQLEQQSPVCPGVQWETTSEVVYTICTAKCKKRIRLAVRRGTPWKIWREFDRHFTCLQKARSQLQQTVQSTKIKQR